MLTLTEKAIDHKAVNGMVSLSQYLDYLFADEFSETIINTGEDFLRLIVNGQRNGMSLQLALHFAAWVGAGNDYYVESLCKEQILNHANSLKTFNYTYANADCDYWGQWYSLVYSLPLKVIQSYVSFNRWTRARSTAEIRL